MPDDHDLTLMAAELGALGDRAAALSDQLAAAARSLADNGLVPGVEVQDELDLVRAQFADLRRRLVEMASDLDVATVHQAREIASIGMLRDLLQTIQHVLEQRAAEQMRQAALVVLGRVRDLRHRDESVFAPLEQCQSAAERLGRVVAELDRPAANPDIDALATGQHGLAHLVEFVEHQHELDDSRWAFLQDSLAENFGRGLAIAAARGKLVFSDGSEPAVPSTAVPAPPSPVAPVAPESEDDDEDRWPTLPIVTRTLPDDLDLHAGDVGSLVWHALRADRPALGFLAHNLSAGTSGTLPGVPEWLLRALSLSRHVQYTNGDIALMLTDDFAGCNLSASHTGEDLSRAHRLLIAAAALRPALVAPDTGAWSVLRALPAEPDLPGLHACVRLIADYGERHPPLGPHMFAPDPPPSLWRDMMEDLLREVGSWRVRFLGLRSTFPPATEVWRRWLRPDGLVHALLNPLTIDAHGLDTARGLVDRLSNDAQIRWEVTDTDRRLLGRKHGPDISSQSEAVHLLAARVREAVAFARRWIALQEHRPGRAEVEAHRIAARFRAQLLEQRGRATEELLAVRDRDVPLPEQAAAVQCDAALESIFAILDGRCAFETWSRTAQEPSPNLLLYRESLRSGGVLLNPEWSPVRVDQPAFARGLRGLVDADHLPDWRSIFEIHRQRHDHLASAQVLECLELEQAGPSSSLDELRASRTADLQQSRTALVQQVERVREALDAAAASGRLDHLDRARLQMVVERIGVAVPAIRRFDAAHQRLRLVLGKLESLTSTASGSRESRSSVRGALGAMGGPSLLVAAPGLGASHLLRSVAETYHTSDGDHVALVIDQEAQGQSDPFWAAVRGSLAAVPGLEAAADSGNPVDAAMLAWIQSRPERRLLVLVDHADVLLEADLNTASATQEDARFPLATRLAELMRQSDDRVKFVLAGTVPLLRLARIEGYPLAARGCARLAPLLDDSGLREAQQLVLASLEHAVPETPGVLARMLSLANYAPETIQQLATLTAKRAPDGRVGPAVLDALTASHEGASATTRALRGAVQGDPRHAIILYSFALACRRPPQDEVEDVADGVSSQWLAARLAEWSGIHHPSSDGAVVDALLDEMIALNVLQLTERDRYILASPNLLPYLGRDEELFDTLLDQASALERSGTIEHLTP